MEAMNFFQMKKKMFLLLLKCMNEYVLESNFITKYVLLFLIVHTFMFMIL